MSLTSMRVRAFGKERKIVELVRQEAWMWLEGLLGWIPGRSGRLIRGAVFTKLLSARGWLYIEERVQIRMPNNFSCGKHVTLARDVQLTCGGGLTVGDHVGFGPGTRVFTNGHRMDSLEVPIMNQGLYDKPVRVCDDVWIGANVMILPGVTIGRGSVIAAGAVVTRDIPEFSLAAGVPAKPVKSRRKTPASS